MAGTTKDQEAAPKTGGAKRNGGTDESRADLEARMAALVKKVPGKRGHSAAEKAEARKLAEQLGCDPPNWSKEKPAAAKSTARKTSSSGKRPKYPPEVSEAVKIAKRLRGTEHGQPGPKQHVAVRTAIHALNGRRAGSPAPITEREALNAVGMTRAALLKAASGSMPTEKLREQTDLRELAAKVGDPFCRGRNLASIVGAIVEQAGD